MRYCLTSFMYDHFCHVYFEKKNIKYNLLEIGAFLIILNVPDTERSKIMKIATTKVFTWH